MYGLRRHPALLVVLFAFALAACQQTPTQQPTHPEPLGEGDTLEHAPGRSGEIKTANLIGPGGEPFTFSYELIDGLGIVQGDMIIGTEEELASLEDADGITVQSTLLYRRVCWTFLFIDVHCENYRWPDAIVPYVLADDWDDPDRAGDENAEMRAAIRTAMDEVELVTAIRFVPRSGQDDYVRFRDGSGCSATVGHEGGRQNINLAFNCRNPWVIVHEMLHMLGFNHEQSRHDRGSNVQILFDNILGDKKHNFEVADLSYDYGPYDFDSLMHYGMFSFCRRDSADNCVGPTITVPSGAPIGQRSRMSTRDIASVNRAYPGEPPTVDITSPTPGSSHAHGYGGLLLQADVDDPEGKDVSVTWWSDTSGLVASGNPAFADTENMAYGAHVLTARAIDPQGHLATDTVTVTITNAPPTVAVLRPTAGTYCIDETLTFQATVFDPNQTGYTLPDAGVTWRVGAGAPFATGKNTTNAFTVAGPIQVIVRATDEQNAFAEDSVGLVITDCSDQPPVVTIASPDDESSFFYDGFDDALAMWYADITFSGSATDPEDGALSGASLVWSTSRTDLQAPALGTGTSLTARLYSNVCEGVSHDVMLSATDSFGNVRTALVRVSIGTIC